MRVAIVRTGLVLGRDGGVLAKLLPLFRTGLGGPVASGQQWYSWVHLEDTVGIYLLAIDSYTGVLNATATHHGDESRFHPRACGGRASPGALSGTGVRAQARLR